MIIVNLTGTTDSGGDLTVTNPTTVQGLLYAVQLIDGDLADGVDITLTAEVDQLSIPLLVKADFNTDQMSYPRVLQNLNTDGSALATHTLPLVVGKLKMVIAAGGGTKTGGCRLYIIE